MYGQKHQENSPEVIHCTRYQHNHHKNHRSTTGDTKQYNLSKSVHLQRIKAYTVYYDPHNNATVYCTSCTIYPVSHKYKLTQSYESELHVSLNHKGNQVLDWSIFTHLTLLKHLPQPSKQDEYCFTPHYVIQ